MVGGLIEEQNVRLAQRDLREGHARFLASREIPDRDGVRVALQSVPTQQISHYNHRVSKKTNGPGISWWGRATADTPREKPPSAATLNP